jgi:hypothetical protein
MYSKNRKTLEAVFSQPTKNGIKWINVKNLLMTVSPEKIEGEGALVSSVKGKVKMPIHRSIDPSATTRQGSQTAPG